MPERHVGRGWPNSSAASSALSPARSDHDHRCPIGAVLPLPLGLDQPWPSGCGAKVDNQNLVAQRDCGSERGLSEEYPGPW